MLSEGAQVTLSSSTPYVNAHVTVSFHAESLPLPQSTRRKTARTFSFGLKDEGFFFSDSPWQRFLYDGGKQ